MGIRPPNSRSVGSHGYGNVWHVVPRCNYDQVQNHNCEHYIRWHCRLPVVLLLLWNCKSITSLLWIPKTMYHVLGIKLHMKQKFTECLTKRHRSIAEYCYVLTQCAVESEDAEWGFRTLSGDFEQVARPQNKSYDVIDMDRNVSCEQYISTRHSRVRKENQFGNLKNVSF
jgi:hypothetical protein